MEMHQLEYVLAVARFNNFTRAAEEIKISQSSLSQQINKLESELGTNLFVRTTRSVQLTPAGTEFLKYAQRILSEVDDARRSVQDYVSIVKGDLSLGTLAVIGNYNLPNLIKSFQNSFPGIKMRIVEDQCDDLLAMLHSSRIDIAFVQSIKPNPQFIFHPLTQDIMVAVVSSNHPLANRVSVDIKELKNETFILTPPSSGHFQDFHAACLTAGFEPQIILSCAIVKTMLGFVREDIGITVLSSKVAMAEQDAGIRILGLTPTIHRTISMVTRKSSDTAPAVKMFLKFTTQWLETQRSIERAKASGVYSTTDNNDIRLICG